MLVKKNLLERWKLTGPFMHITTLINLLIWNKLQYIIRVEPKNDFQVHLFFLYVVSRVFEF